MKASLEYGLIFLTGCFFLTLLIQLTFAFSSVHQGHLYLNYLTHITENYDGRLEDVKTHDQTNSVCPECTYEHKKLGDRYELKVFAPVRIPIIKFDSKMEIYSLTTPFEE